MPSSATGGGFTQPSQATAGLKAISSEDYPFVNRDFVKNIAYLNQATDSLAVWAQTAQSGIDNSNKNFIAQIQGVFSDLMVLLGGGEPTGIDLGDFKYVMQGLGALLGINPDTPFPLNLVEAMTHLFTQYILPLEQLTDLVYDSMAAWAEHIGMSDDAVNSIRDFSDAVVNYHHDKQDLGEQFDIATHDFFAKLKMAKKPFDNSKALEFWDNVGDAIDNVVNGVRDTLLNILSDIVVVIFKSMTYTVNAFNPRTALESFGIEFLGPELAPALSATTNVWSVSTDANTGWVFDNSTTHDTSSGSFKTNGNSTNKRVLTAVKQICATGDVYNLSAWVKWSSVPTNTNTSGICMVFYNNATEVFQHNIDMKFTHGAASDWVEFSEAITIPENANGFKIGARITSSFTSGVVWVDGMSCLKQLPLGQGAVDGIMKNIPVISDLAEIFSGVEDGNLNDIGTWVNNTVSDITTVWNSFFGKHQNGPSMVLDPGFDSASVWQYEPGVQSTEAKMDGTYSRKLTGSNQQLYFTAAGINNRNSIPAHGFRCVPRQKFAISCYARRAVLNGPLGQGFIGVILYPGTGAGGQDVIITSASTAQLVWLPSIWVNFKVTYTVPDTNANGDRYTHIVPFFGTSSVVGANDNFYIDELSVKDVTENQDVINAITAAMGSSGTDADAVQSALQAIPGPNIASTVSAAVVPGLDASKITSGELSQSQIADLPEDLEAVTAAAQAAKELALIQAADPMNFAAGSDFETWSEGWPNHPIHQWDFESAGAGRYSISTAGFLGDSSGRSGGKGMRVRWNMISGVATLKNHPSVQEGEQFYIEFWARRDSYFNGGSLSKFRVGYNDENIFLDEIAFGANTFTEVNTWRQFSKTITVPEGAYYLNFEIYTDHSSTNATDVYINEIPSPHTPLLVLANQMGQIFFDDIVVRKQVPPEGFTEIPQDKVADLAVNLKALAAYRGANLIPNGTFEDSNYRNKSWRGWYWDDNGPGAGYDHLAEYDTAHVRNGTQSLKMWTGGMGWSRAEFPLDPLWTGPVHISCTPTDIFQVEGWVYGASTNQYPSGQGGFAFYIWPFDASNAILTTSPIGQQIGVQLVTSVVKSASNGVWTKVSGIFSPPAGCYQFILAAEGQADVGATYVNTWWLDDVALYRVTETTQITRALYNSDTTSSTVLSSVVPALDASKITTGTINTSIVPSLDASKISTGTLGAAQIPSLDAGKITTGTLNTGLIPTLPQSQITNLGTDLTSKLSAYIFDAKSETGSNLVYSPNFENSLVTRYAYDTLTSYVYSTEQKHGGTQSLKITISGSTGLCLRTAANNNYWPVTPGDVYYAEVWVRAHVSNNFGSSNIWLGADCSNSITGTLSLWPGITVNNNTLSSSTWTKISGYITMPANCDRAVFALYFSTNFANNIFYVDDVTIREVTKAAELNTALYNATSPAATVLTSVVPALDASKITTGTIGTGIIPTLDGSKIGSGTVSANYIAALDASKVSTGNFAQSRVTNLTTDLGTAQTTANTAKSLLGSKVQAGHNIASNPSYENTSFSPGNATYSTEQKRTGTYSLKIIGDGVSYPTASICASDSNSLLPLVVSEGDIFYAEIWIYGKATNVDTTAGIWIQVTFLDANGAYYSNAQVGRVGGGNAYTGVWTKLSGYLTIPSGVSWVTFCCILNVTMPAGNTYYLDDPLLYRVTEIANTNTTLFNQKTPGSAVLPSVVPTLDASKVTTGTFGSGLIPSLDASKVTTGSFPQSQVTSLTTDLSTINTAAGRVAAVTTRKIASNTNLVVDGSCSNATAWNTSVSTLSQISYSVSTEQFRSAPSSLKIVIVASGYPALPIIQDGTTTYVKLSCQPGDIFYAEYWVKAHASNTNNKNFFIQFLSHDSTGVGADYAAGTWTNSAQISPNTTWQKVFGYFTIPAGRDQLTVYLSGANGGTNGESYYIDDIVVREITSTNQLNQALYGANTSASTVLTSVVPALDGSKIASGTVASNFIAALDAAKIATGTFTSTLIPLLDGAKIGSGAVAAAFVAALDASKIATGNFAQSRVTNLTTDLGTAQSTATTAKTLATGQIARGSNIVSNPSFESSGFWLGSGSGYGYSAEQKRNGTQSLKIVHDGSNWIIPYLNSDATTVVYIPVAGGDVFYCEGYVYGHASNVTTTQTIWFQINYQNADGSSGNATCGSTVGGLALNGVWTKISGIVTLPSTAVRINGIWPVGSNLMPANQTFYWDDVIIREITSPTATNQALYGSNTTASTVQGSAVPALDASKVTTGNFAQSRVTNLTTDISATKSLANTALQRGSNLATNGSFENTNLYIYKDANRDFSTEQKRSGTQSWKTTGAKWAPLFSNETAYITLPCTDSDRFYAEIWLYGHASNPSANDGATMYVQTWNAAGTLLETTYFPTYFASTDLDATKGVWTKMSGYFTPAAGATSFQITHVTNATNITLYWDDFACYRVTESVKTNQSLYGTNTSASTIISGAVPSLDGSKIGSGTVAANFIAALDAAKIATGTFVSTLIPLLDGAKIGSGSVAAAFIAALDASKIASGTLGTAQIPTLDGSKIGSGTVGATYIPNLDASKITTGNFPQSQITNLSADLTSKLSTAIFNAKSETGANLVYAPYFEDSTITRYPYGTLNTYTYSTEQKHSGTKSLKITINDTTTGISFRNAPNTDYWPVTPGDVYYVEVWLRSHASNNFGDIYAYLGVDCSNSVTGALTSPAATAFDTGWIPSNSWYKASAYFTMPTNCDRAVFYFYFGPNYSGNIFYMDDITIREVTKTSELNAALYGTTSPAATVLSSAVPALDGSKITTGTLNTAQIPSLSTSKITTGTFGTSMIADAAITGVKTSGLDASKITSGTIATAQLPNALAVGSGYITRRTSGTIGLNISASSFTTGKFNYSHYDSSTNFGTTDYSVSSGGSGELKVSAVNAGWYMVEVSIGLQRTARLVTYQISAALFQGGSAEKYGPAVNYAGANSAQIPFCAQGSWIVYLEPDEYVSPGWAIYSTTGLDSSAPIIGVNNNKDTYFAISLLNRSLS